MADPITKTVVVPVSLDATDLARQLEILRNLCSQVGFALDTAILALRETARYDGSTPGNDLGYGHVREASDRGDGAP